MAITEIGMEMDPYWWAYTPDGSAIEVPDDEEVIVDSHCRITTIAKPKVVLPETTTFVVTDRRIA
jgi:hypothetical protein